MMIHYYREGKQTREQDGIVTTSEVMMTLILAVSRTDTLVCVHSMYL